MPRRSPIAVESAYESLDAADAIRRETLGFYCRGCDSGRRHDDLVVVRRPVERMARLAVFRWSGAGHRRRGDLAATAGLSRAGQIAAPDAPVMRTAGPAARPLR